MEVRYLAGRWSSKIEALQPHESIRCGGGMLKNCAYSVRIGPPQLRLIAAQFSLHFRNHPN